MKRNKKIKKENFCKKHYSLSWQYIKECRNYIFFIVLVFLLAAVVALFYQPPIAVDWIREFIEDLLTRTAGLSRGQMIIFILDNNLKSSFIGLILGLAFGIFPVLIALANGYVLGFVAERSVQIEGLSVLLRLVPHGIFELPAVILALALGTKLGMFWFVRDKKKEFLRRLENALRVFLFVILPLLVIAAIIEGILVFSFG